MWKNSYKIFNGSIDSCCLQNRIEKKNIIKLNLGKKINTTEQNWSKKKSITSTRTEQEKKR